MKNLLFSIHILLVLGLVNGCRNGNTDKNQLNTTMETVTGTNFIDSGYAPVNGINMYYEIYGEGKPLVLIHGGGSTIHTTFGRIIPELSKHYKLIAVELQAHGHTKDRDTPLSFEQDADDVAALLKTLNIIKADIFGFSNGGNTALQLAVRHPGLVNKIIAASPLLKKDGAFEGFWEFMKTGTFEQMPQQYKDAYLKITNDSARLLNMFNRCAERMLDFKEMPDEQLTSIKAPVLLVSGDKDVGTPRHMVEMSALIPNCRLAIIPGGHGEFLGEITTLQPGQTEYEILPVLKKFFR